MAYVMETIFILLGIIGIFFGLTQYLFWIGTAPGGGFMPTAVGVLLILISVTIIFEKKDKVKIKFDKKELYPLAAILAVLVLNSLIGMLPSLTVMVIIWLKWVEKYPLKNSIIMALIIGVVIYAIFGFWLKVPFPMGLLDI